MSDKHGPSYCLDCFNYFWTSTCDHPTDEVWAERNRIISLLEKEAHTGVKAIVNLEFKGLLKAIALIKGESQKDNETVSPLTEGEQK